MWSGLWSLVSIASFFLKGAWPRFFAILERFWEAKREAKREANIDFWDVFYDAFFECVLESIFW